MMFHTECFRAFHLHFNNIRAMFWRKCTRVVCDSKFRCWQEYFSIHRVFCWKFLRQFTNTKKSIIMSWFITTYRKVHWKNVGVSENGKIPRLEMSQRAKSSSSVSQIRGNVKNHYSEICKNTVAQLWND